jgi:hypothetical protein
LVANCPLLSGLLEIEVYISNPMLKAAKNRKLPAPNPNITFIMFNNSTCDADVNPSELARFLVQMFPWLESVECYHDEVWDVVAKLVENAYNN